MSSIRLETLLKITDERGLTRTIPIATTLSSRSKLEERDYTIADAAVQLCWDPTAVATENPSSFSFLLIWSDGDVDVEFVTDDGGDVGKIIWSERVVKDVPLILGADDSYAAAAPGDDIFAGTIDLIERIRIKNGSGAERKVKVIIME